MTENTTFIINGQIVTLNIQNSQVVFIDNTSFQDKAEHLIKEWDVIDNTTDIISLESRVVVIIDPLGTEHRCVYTTESRRERDSQTNVYVTSLNYTDCLLDEYIDADIDKAGIIELVSYALGEERIEDTFVEYNFSFKVLDEYT